MYLLVNELSFQGQANELIDSHKLMNDLISVIRSLRPICGTDPIRTSMTLWEKELFRGYNVNRWLNDTNRDQMLWFKAIVRKGPYIETILDEELDYHECRFHGDDVSSTSLAGAVFLGGILSSLQDADRFDLERISLEYREGEVPFTKFEVLNVYDPRNVENFIKGFSIEVLEHVSSWDQLWKRRAELFSELTFCDCVRDQLNRLDFGINNFKIIRRHLTKMNEYCRRMRMKNEDFIPDYTAMGIEASKESPETLKHFDYQREFLCPDGSTRLFDWHSKQKGQNLRVHFCPPDHGGRDFIIGYVGPHLDTIKYH